MFHPTARPTRRIATSATGILAAVALTACGSANTTSAPTGEAHGTHATSSAPAPAGTTGTGTGTGPADASRAGDVAFAQGMIPHHEQAVEMSDMALQKKSASAQVRSLATQIKAAQDPEIATMRGWLTAWGAPTAAPSRDHGTADGGHDGHGGHGGMMSAQDMTALAKAEGADFDRMWITMMIEHHEGAVTMSEQVLTTTRDPQVAALARAIITGQKAEIATMRDLL